mmetsp:Transcript_4251/g.16028  ORF Transcript_4251/g.16028 Transcript_4251/m.16028 type:complete len:1017 (-) Transcript_4251:1864-4914(-)|eukprot:CAMPEP_0117441226 /NCGR_PEP_ID=MMETSP0759-20121206/3527_1 /TAXON_ID=63605 /ORGANISM="Percolomonas cosmopolitus, Strain WS" /LENGTH=1016 /DNA_ID=CAMNT_0005233077 /DNA_START=1248 /DNA_END=4298 /DNA_ORIENTATION=-
MVIPPSLPSWIELSSSRHGDHLHHFCARGQDRPKHGLESAITLHATGHKSATTLKQILLCTTSLHSLPSPYSPVLMKPPQSRNKKVAPVFGDSDASATMPTSTSASSFSQVVSKANQEFFSTTSPKEEEENAMEQIIRLEKRMKLGRMQSFCRSLKCLLLTGVLMLVSMTLVVSVVWFSVFLTTLTQFGAEARVGTFAQIHSDVSGSLSRMRSVVVSLSTITNGFSENTTTPDTLRDVSSAAHQSLAKEFGRIGVSLYTANMNRAAIWINYARPDNPNYVSGNLEFKNSSGIFLQQLTKNLATGASTTTPKNPLAAQIFLRPQTFVDHVLGMGQTDPLLFTLPAPTTCSMDPNVEALKDGLCELVIFKVWSHHIDSSGLHTSVILSTTTDSLSQKLTQMTNRNAMSFLLSHDRKLIAVSRGFERIQEDEKKWRLYHYNGIASTLLTASEYPDDLVRNSVRAIQEAHGDDLHVLDASRVLTMTVSGHYVDYQKINLGNTISGYENSPAFSIFTSDIYLDSMVLVHVIGVTAYTNTSIWTGVCTICITLILSLLSLVGVIIVACCINRPVVRLIRQMESVKDMDLHIRTDRFAYFSELRRIQSSFYYLVMNLRESRAFLPSHVLEMIEARRINNSKKKTRKDARESIQTVDDEILSQSSYNTHNPGSQTQSFAGSASHRSHSNITHQFSLGMFHRHISVVEIKLANFSKLIVSTSPKDFVLQHSQLVDLVSKLVAVTKSATLTSFSQDRFVISLNTTISSSEHERKAAKMAMILKHRISTLNDRLSQQALEPFVVVISVCSGDGVVSVLGTHMQKQRVVFGTPIQQAEIQALVAEEVVNRYAGITDSNITILVNQTIIQKLPKKSIHSRIVDVVAMSKKGAQHDDNWKFQYIFELQDIALESKKEMEWMYSQHKMQEEEETTEQNQMLTKFWTLLVGEETKKALELLDTAREKATKDESQNIIFRQLTALVEMLGARYNSSLIEYCENGLSQINTTGEFRWASVFCQVKGEMIGEGDK